jgi:hypothetical protein
MCVGYQQLWDVVDQKLQSPHYNALCVPENMEEIGVMALRNTPPDYDAELMLHRQKIGADEIVLDHAPEAEGLLLDDLPNTEAYGLGLSGELELWKVKNVLQKNGGYQPVAVSTICEHV